MATILMWLVLGIAIGGAVAYLAIESALDVIEQCAIRLARWPAWIIFRSRDEWQINVAGQLFSGMQRISLSRLAQRHGAAMLSCIQRQYH